MNLRDPAAFGDIYTTHARSILIFLTRRTYDPETALDLTAETFALAFASRGHYRGSTDDELAAWLFGIARHVLSRFVRKGRAERRALERLGVSEATARARVSRGLRALGAALDLRPSTQETLG